MARRRSGRAGVARPLRGLRFGYGHGEQFTAPALIAARIPAHEVAARGEDDGIERGGRFYCAALPLATVVRLAPPALACETVEAAERLRVRL